MGISSFLVQFLTICVNTFPLRFKSSTTGIFSPVPRPRFPHTLVGPKYDSSTSISPFTISSCNESI